MYVCLNYYKVNSIERIAVYAVIGPWLIANTACLNLRYWHAGQASRIGTTHYYPQLVLTDKGFIIKVLVVLMSSRSR